MKIINTPFVHCWIKERFLHNLDESKNGLVEAYIFAVTCLPNRPLLFTAHTEHGAIFSRLPINAFLHERIENHDNFDIDQLEPWSCLGEDAEVIQHDYLKDYWVKVRTPKFDGEGKYLYTVDFVRGGFSESPTQHKSFNIIALENGHLGAFPNNYCLFKDDHFTSNESPNYRRNTHYWTGCS